MSLWVAVLKSEDSDGKLPFGSCQRILIETEKWFDARAYALQKLGENAEVTACTQGLEPDIELEWRGSDFNNTGERQLWMREMGKIEWVRV